MSTKTYLVPASKALTTTAKGATKLKKSLEAEGEEWLIVQTGKVSVKPMTKKTTKRRH